MNSITLISVYGRVIVVVEPSAPEQFGKVGRTQYSEAGGIVLTKHVYASKYFALFDES